MILKITSYLVFFTERVEAIKMQKFPAFFPSAPEGIVLDLEENKVLWTDIIYETISSANLDGSNTKTIIRSNLYLPWKLAISQKRG